MLENQTNQPQKYLIKYSLTVVMLSAHYSAGSEEVWVEPNSTKTGEMDLNFLVYGSYNGNYPIIARTEIVSPERDTAENRGALSIRPYAH